MKHLKHFESKLYEPVGSMADDRIKNYVNISKKTLGILDEFGIKYNVSTSSGHYRKSLNGKEFKFAYIGTSGTPSFLADYIVECDDEWFLIGKSSDYYLIDGYDGLKQFIEDKMI